MTESDADTADEGVSGGDAVPADDADAEDAVPADDADSEDADEVDRYVCSVCHATTERSYGVRYIVTTCADCGRHGRLVHASLVALLERVPESDRPDGWADRPLDERLLDALQRGVISLGDTEV